jgi:hypothetical protein
MGRSSARGGLRSPGRLHRPQQPIGRSWPGCPWCGPCGARLAGAAPNVRGADRARLHGPRHSRMSVVRTVRPEFARLRAERAIPEAVTAVRRTFGKRGASARRTPGRTTVDRWATAGSGTPGKFRFAERRAKRRATAVALTQPPGVPAPCRHATDQLRGPAVGLPTSRIETVSARGTDDPAARWLDSDRGRFGPHVARPPAPIPAVHPRRHDGECPSTSRAASGSIAHAPAAFPCVTAILRTDATVRTTET